MGSAEHLVPDRYPCSGDGRGWWRARGRMDISTHGRKRANRRPWIAAWADRAPLEQGNAMSLSTHAIPPIAVAPDGAAEPHTVVVGYDGSDEARAAFGVAIDRARPSDRIVLVHATAPASN